MPGRRGLILISVICNLNHHLFHLTPNSNHTHHKATTPQHYNHYKPIYHLHQTLDNLPTINSHIAHRLLNILQSPHSIRYIYNNKLFLAINIDISNINTKKELKIFCHLKKMYYLCSVKKIAISNIITKIKK